MSTRKRITICSSASFYKQALAAKEALEGMGFEVRIPLNAERMQENNDFTVSRYKTWFNNPDEYAKKAYLMETHFNEVKAGDATLILNYEKNGIAGYIGGNVLMEMAVAFHHKKPIYILNVLPETLPYYEEIMGVQPIVLNGDLNKLREIS